MSDVESTPAFEKEQIFCSVIVNLKNEVGVTILAPRKREGKKDKKRFNLFVSQFVDCQGLTSLESFLLQYQPTKIICSDKLTNIKKLNNICETLSADLQQEKSSLFTSKDIDQDLPRVLGESSISRYDSLLRLDVAMQSLQGLLKVLKIMSDIPEKPLGSFELKSGDMDAFMKLDSAASTALNLFSSSSGHGGVKKYDSLFDILNHTRTKKIGERLLNKWIRQPLTELEDILSRQRIVKLLFSQHELRDSIRDGPLKTCPDLETLSRKLEKGKHVKLEDLYALYQFVNQLPNLLKHFEEVVDEISETSGEEEIKLQSLINHKIIIPLKQLIEDFDGYQKLIAEVLDFDAIERNPPEFLINPEWDEDLKVIANERDIVYNEICDLYEATKAAWDSSLDLKCDFDKRRGYVFRVNKKWDKEVRAKKNVVIIQTKTSGIVFTITGGHNSLESLGERYSRLAEDFVSAQGTLVDKALVVAATYVPIFESVSSLMAEIDVLCSFAHAAVNGPIAYICPNLTPLGQGDTIIKKSRHPVLEFQDDVSFIANDIILSRKDSRFIIITGPNMGGKSTYIRQIGCLQLMAQIGSFIPAESATISVVDSILCRVGAGDVQSRGISTFMSEMIDAANILSTATNKSLVIIDELGRGTSTYDGYGLAYAISEYIINKLQCFCMFATHYHEMTSLAQNAKGAINLHVTAHTTSQSITMLYNILKGPSDQSYGIHVAQLANFPSSVLEEARHKVIELEKNGEMKAKKKEKIRKLLTEIASLKIEKSSKPELLAQVKHLVEEYKI